MQMRNITPFPFFFNFILLYSKKIRLIPRCSALPQIASCRTLSPAAVQLRKLVAGGGGISCSARPAFRRWITPRAGGPLTPRKMPAHFSVTEKIICSANYDSCSPASPGAVRLRKPAAGGEIPDTAHACIAVIHFEEDFTGQERAAPYGIRKFRFRRAGKNSGARNARRRSGGRSRGKLSGDFQSDVIDFKVSPRCALLDEKDLVLRVFRCCDHAGELLPLSGFRAEAQRRGFPSAIED